VTLKRGRAARSLREEQEREKLMIPCRRVYVVGIGCLYYVKGGTYK
jgi:hypothetical protein